LRNDEKGFKITTSATRLKLNSVHNTKFLIPPRSQPGRTTEKKSTGARSIHWKKNVWGAEEDKKKNPDRSRGAKNALKIGPQLKYTGGHF